MALQRTARRTRQERGASTVEVALSLLLLVPLFLYIVYAGESFLAATRAQEAEISASWDVTAYRLHDYVDGQDYESSPGNPSRYTDVTDVAARRVRRELRTLDSFSDPTRPGTGKRFLISQQRLEGLECVPFDARTVANGALLTFDGVPVTARRYLHRGGYVVCRAKVNFSPQFIPRTQPEGSRSKLDFVTDVLQNGFTLCGSGSTLMGCEGAETAGIVVLTNDWALEDGRENPVGTRANRRYFNVGNAIYGLEPEKGEAGTGGQQVREALQFLMDENDADYGDTSTFKFGFYNPMRQTHRYPANNHGGQEEAHLSPWDDGEGDFASGSSVYSDHRDRDNYLGHPKEDFNRP
jgi:hypothetical protein